LLHQILGVYLPLITTNCAVLGVALLAVGGELSLLETIVFSMGAAAGFTLVMVLFGAIRERLEGADVPAAFRGAPIALITAGIMSLGFLGFGGLA
jgi:electron transport complex protein RnfA